MSHRLICISTSTEGTLIISAVRRLTRSSSGTVMMRDTGIIGMISMKLMKSGVTDPKETDIGGKSIGVMTIMMVIDINNG